MPLQSILSLVRKCIIDVKILVMKSYFTISLSTYLFLTFSSVDAHKTVACTASHQRGGGGGEKRGMDNEINLKKIPKAMCDYAIVGGKT